MRSRKTKVYVYVIIMPELVRAKNEAGETVILLFPTPDKTTLGGWFKQRLWFT